MDDTEILKFIAREEDPVVTTNEVADFLDFSNPGSLKRLHDLSDRGLLDFKKAGKNHVWWITDAGLEFINSV